MEATQHLGFALQFAIEALRFGEGPALAGRLVPMLPPLLQLQVLIARDTDLAPARALCRRCEGVPPAVGSLRGSSTECWRQSAGKASTTGYIWVLHKLPH